MSKIEYRTLIVGGEYSKINGIPHVSERWLRMVKIFSDNQFFIFPDCLQVRLMDGMKSNSFLRRINEEDISSEASSQETTKWVWREFFSIKNEKTDLICSYFLP